ncbi:MAG: glutathione S-transferase family protein [Pseudooceanicola sp.]
MELFVSVGPNPRLVRMYLAEKGIELPEVHVDLLGAENRRSEYLAINPGGQMPALRLADGQVIAETLAICEYLEELHPDPPLFGRSPEARAETRMWLRRVENLYVRPMIDSYRAGVGYERFKDRMRLLPHAVPEILALATDGLDWLDAQLGQGPFIAGDRLTLADIMLYCFMDFAIERGVLPASPAHENLAPWFDRMAERPSARQTRHYTYHGRQG